MQPKLSGNGACVDICGGLGWVFLSFSSLIWLTLGEGEVEKQIGKRGRYGYWREEGKFDAFEDGFRISPSSSGL